MKKTQNDSQGGRITPPSVYACVLARRGYSSSGLTLKTSIFEQPSVKGFSKSKEYQPAWFPYTEHRKENHFAARLEVARDGKH